MHNIAFFSGRWEPTPNPSQEGNLGRWGDGNPPLTPPRRGIWGDGEMGRWGDGDPPLTPPRRGIWGDGENRIFAQFLVFHIT
ncbi:hypothetical protein [Okeania sp. SIO1I7]|uniref:hypothetical protein n=1 Tax=Okeania sp. SIO1I7 TaxID=2607772 RepID=UPI0013FA5D23|nr:hypothetical protein [Okeania sp. SIO1I7]NET25353.1 hypothetical protein [Okeania sp. SIO1I7]